MNGREVPLQVIANAEILQITLEAGGEAMVGEPHLGVTKVEPT